MSTLSDRTHKPRLAEGVLLYLASVALVAAAIIVLFSVSVTSLLDPNKETFTGARARIEITSTANKSIGTASFYKGDSTAPVPAQTKSSSSSEASNMPPSTSVPLPFGMTRVETEAEPAPQPTPDREANVTAVEASHGRSHEVITQPLPIADEASAVQHDLGTMALLATLATFDLQLIQILQNFEIQLDDYANLAQDGATLATGSRFREEPPMKESAMFSGSTARPRSPVLRHAASHRSSAVAADHKATRKLNRAELSRLLDPH
jgi:hypothetical protein